VNSDKAKLICPSGKSPVSHSSNPSAAQQNAAQVARRRLSFAGHDPLRACRLTRLTCLPLDRYQRAVRIAMSKLDDRLGLF
jgi:hypothetical protein